MITESWRRAIVAVVQSEPSIAEVWLFGSRARGEQRPDSDLDLAIVVSAPDEDEVTEWAFNAQRWRRRLSAALPWVAVDLQHWSPSATIIGPAVQREGKLIYRRRSTQSTG